MTRSFDVFFDLRLNKRLSKQPWGWWFETPAWSLWRHRNDTNHLNEDIQMLHMKPLVSRFIFQNGPLHANTQIELHQKLVLIFDIDYFSRALLRKNYIWISFQSTYYITVKSQWARWRLKSLNCLFRHKSKKISKLRVTGLCEGNSPVTGEFPAQMASNAENASIWWRHRAVQWSIQQYVFGKWLKPLLKACYRKWSQTVTEE